MIRQTAEGVEIAIRAQPRASRSEVAGPYGDALRVRIAAPPVDGAANDELVELLADTLGVRTSAVELVRGHGGRNKTVRVRGITAALARKRLGV